MSDLNKLKELADTVCAWPKSELWHSKNLEEILKFAVEQAERLEAAEQVDFELMAYRFAWKKLVARAEAAEKHVVELENDEVRQRLANAEHQLYMKDLAISNIKASRRAQWRKRKEAEAELARRDKEVGAPVGYFIESRDDECGHIEWSECSKGIPGAVAFYTAAQPAALPPEIINADAPDQYSSDETYAWVAGANWMREQAKALGVKPLRVKCQHEWIASEGRTASGFLCQKCGDYHGPQAQGVEVEE